jgi:hypothetical protein
MESKEAIKVDAGGEEKTLFLWRRGGAVGKCVKR